MAQEVSAAEEVPADEGAVAGEVGMTEKAAVAQEAPLPQEGPQAEAVTQPAPGGGWASPSGPVALFPPTQVPPVPVPPAPVPPAPPAPLPQPQFVTTPIATAPIAAPPSGPPAAPVSAPVSAPPSGWGAPPVGPVPGQAPGWGSLAPAWGPPSEAVRTADVAGALARVGLGAGAVLALLAVVVPWHGTGWFGATSRQWAEDLPSLLLVGAAAVACWWVAARRFAAVVALLVAAFLGIGLIPAFLGDTPLAAGPLVSLASVACLLCGGVLLLVQAPVALERRPTAIAWAVGAAALAIVWVVGDWLPWVRETLRIGLPGQTWRATGTSTLVRDCCVPFTDDTWPTRIWTALLFVLIVAAAVALALLRGAVAGWALAALGLLYASDSLSWLTRLADPAIDLKERGYSAGEIAQAQLTGTTAGLPGGWISTVACLLLIALGLVRALTARERRRPGVPVPTISGPPVPG